MKRFQCLIYLVFVSMSPYLFADSKELFKEVPSQKSQKLSEYNDLFLNKTLYFSTRHRIVKVNTALLTSSNKDGNFILNPFKDVSINVQTKRMTVSSPYHGAWHGEIESDISLEDDISQLTDYERGGFSAEEFKSFFTNVTFYFHDWDVDLDTNTASTSNQNKTGTTSPEPVEDVVPPKLKRKAFRTARGRFTEITTGQTFVIIPLKYTPKYHVIYEQDDSKIFTTGNDVPNSEPPMSREDTLADENLLKAIQHRLFLTDLPKATPGKTIKGDML